MDELDRIIDIVVYCAAHVSPDDACDECPYKDDGCETLYEDVLTQLGKYREVLRLHR